MVDKKLTAELINPGNEYRGAPFWSLNGRLEPDELRRQVRIFHRMGMGGFFMHSRIGLETPYLSKEWMDCIEACVDEARKFGMRAWLYDEDRWPSGYAGGLVTKNPKYRGRQLVLNTLERAGDLKWSTDTVAAYTARVEGDKASHVRRLRKGIAPRLAKGECILAFNVKVDDCTSWYNGFTYLDTMNYRAVREFIRVTHEAYAKRFGDDFGRTIPGIFTDEPNVKEYSKVKMPWTQELPRVFRRRYGYDILDHLPEVLFEVDGKTVTQAALDMHDCTTLLFVDAYARQIGEWCQKHNLQHTGHVLSEETLVSQMKNCGAAMRFYEYMQAPGIDVLTQHMREYDTAKQVSSIAHQFGQRWRLSETYGCTGWDFTWEAHKAVSDWQAALGINLRCQHLSYYTMGAEAKRDYPASIFFQSPWWKEYSKVEDYFARINVLMSRGTEVRDVLVLHPIESMWAVPTRDEKSRKMLNEAHWRLRDNLLAANMDFDYGDEDILARHGRVKKTDGKSALRIGKAEYKAVVVSGMLTMRASTLRLLRQFRDAGGQVVFAYTPPEYVNGKASGLPLLLSQGCDVARGSKTKLIAAIESARRVSIADESGVEIEAALYCLREDKDSFCLFVCNTGYKKFPPFDEKQLYSGYDPAVSHRESFPVVNIRLSGEGSGQPLEVSTDTGETFAANGKAIKGGWKISTSLEVLGSRLFIFPKRTAKNPSAIRPYQRLKDVSRKTLRQAKWNISLSEENCLVLDRPRYCIAGGAWQKNDEILRIDDQVRNAMGLPLRKEAMVQPWIMEKPKDPRRMSVTLQYSFAADVPPAGPVFLGVENPETFTASINGQPINMNSDGGWWVDMSMRKIPFDTAILRPGINTLEMVCDYSELHPGLEIVYILGGFGVKAAGTELTMTDIPESLRTGDWSRQGLAFYGGNVCYTTKIEANLRKGERLIVNVPKYAGTAARVLVDGRPAGVIAWEPNELDITDHITGGEAALCIEILGSRRNSHGPLHCTPRHVRSCGPREFRVPPYDAGKPDFMKARGYWTDEYVLVPMGLMSPPALVVRR
jgi:hypothetical protein